MKENYDSIAAEITDKHFYIFGTTLYAHIFYLYCEEKQLVQNIDGFVVSDINRDNRKVHRLHNIPIKDISMLKESGQPYRIFIAAKEKTIREQLLFILNDTACIDAFYVSDFVHHVMYARFLSLFFKDIIKKYMFSANPYETGANYISDIGSSNIYKYCHRIEVGEGPDPQIFNTNIKLDELHRRQLGDYIPIEEAEISVTDHNCRIYVAKSHFDKGLKEEFYTSYTVDIQVGASLTDIDIAECKDNTGENISIRNRDYCEMSAVYWIWKNDIKSDYIGVCHYRRRFVINEKMIEFIIDNKLDAVYTIPCLTDGGMRKEFVERNYFLTPKDWDIAKNAILKCCPEYFDTWLEFEKSYFIIPCNMFLMRKHIFDNYCSWAFKILSEIDKYYLEQGIQCNNRYLGYISECLTTVYAMKNKTVLKKGYINMKSLI